MSPALDYYPKLTTSYDSAYLMHDCSDRTEPEVYYNARLDPKKFLDGPLSSNPATRLRQMLARPGIVVRSVLYIWHAFIFSRSIICAGCPRNL